MAELRVKSTGTLKLFENDNTSSVTIASPASLGADRTVTLPDADVTLVSGTMSTGFAVADITGQTALGAEPADTDEFVLSDSGVLKRVDYSYIKAANTPAFKAEMSAGQTITNTSYTILEFDTEVYDTDSRFDTGTYRFTPVTLGKYYVTAGAAFDSATDADKFGVMIRLNGASKVGSTVIQRNYNTAITAGTITVTDVADYLDVHCYQDSGGDLNINNYAPFVHFEAYRLIGV